MSFPTQSIPPWFYEIWQASPWAEQAVAPMYKESDPRRVGTGKKNSHKISGRVGQPGHGHTPPQLCWCDMATATSRKQLGLELGWGGCWAHTWIFSSWPGGGLISLTVPSYLSLLAPLHFPELLCTTTTEAHRCLPPPAPSHFSGLSFSRLKFSLYFFYSHTRIQEP